MPIQTLFLDFGGCLDAPGIHTRTIFFEAFTRVGLVEVDARESFQHAFTLADQRMMASGEAKEMGLRPFNRWNARLIAETLGVGTGEVAADWVSDEMSRYLEIARPTVRALAQELSLGIISNFTGNLEVILREFGLRDFFAHVTESYYAGVAKPEEKIFRLAFAKQSGPAEGCLYVGDNPVNDIAPAKALGWRTALIHRPGERKECGADFYLEDISELRSIVGRI